MRSIVRIVQILILGSLVSFAFEPTAKAAVNGCASSQSACENCCNDAFVCCVESGGTPITDCDWEPGPGQSSCSVPECFGGELCLPD